MQTVKFFRDPVHDIIRVDKSFILKLINSRAMQRLRFIRQLGLCWYVYPGAEHSRFAHSLGVYHISKRFLGQFRSSKKRISKTDSDLVEATALLHDIGHGPFSHAFERALRETKYKYFQSHEEWSKRIIEEDREISKILKGKGRGRSFIKEIKDLLSTHLSGREHLISIVSSQFDADRFDYMLRDSLMTGVNYGKFDLNWIFRNLFLNKVQSFDEDKRRSGRKVLKIVIDGKRGLSSLEDYFVGLFYLHQNVYLHKTVLAAEVMLTSILKSAVDLIKKGKHSEFPWNPILKKIARNERLTVDDYLQLDDYLVFSWIKSWADANKLGVLSRLSKDLLERRLFKSLPFDVDRATIEKKVAEVRKLLKRRKLNPDYYHTIVDVARVAYLDWWDTKEKNKLGQEIFIKDLEGKPKPYTDFAKKNDISNTIMGLNLKKTYLIVSPKVAEDAKKIIGEE